MKGTNVFLNELRIYPREGLPGKAIVEEKDKEEVEEVFEK
jgi:hypothetical protein